MKTGAGALGTNAASHACREASGQGHSMCIALDCTTSHQGNGTSTLERGQLRALKKLSNVFAKPELESKIPVKETLKSWLEDQSSFLGARTERSHLVRATVGPNLKHNLDDPLQQRVAAALLEAKLQLATQAAAHWTFEEVEDATC